MDEQTVRKTFKYKLQPTPEQAMAFGLRRWRELYSAALLERREAWQKCDVSAPAASQSAQLPAVKEVRPQYRDIRSQVLLDVLDVLDVLARLDRAVQAFLGRIQNGETPGYPRLQGANRYNSFTYKQFGNGATLDNGFLVLSKIGRLAVRWSRPCAATPKTVTVPREADGWYAGFACAEVLVRSLPAAGQETGIDLDLEAVATLSNGTRLLHPSCYRRAERRLKAAQRRVSRPKKGSNRRRTTVQVLAAAHLHIGRQRRDFHHKVALQIVRANDTTYHADMQTANLLKHHHLAKSISDVGWSRFLSILSAKAVWAERRVVAVAVAMPPASTSQRCSGPQCGVLVSTGLRVRWHRCPHCGANLHRDHTATLTSSGSGRVAGQRWRRLPRRTEHLPASSGRAST
jgi:putative transposase